MRVQLPTDQYVQHDWPPLVWALMLAVMATAVMVAMCFYLLVSTRAYDAAVRAVEVEPAPDKQQRPRLEGAGTVSAARL